MPEEIFVLVMTVLVAGIAFTGKLVWAYTDRLKHKEITPKSVAGLDARMERIEHAIDSIAVEVERISEGQRFTTKLLADRGPLASLPSAARDRS